MRTRSLVDSMIAGALITLTRYFNTTLIDFHSKSETQKQFLTISYKDVAK